jgi:hypothetical protein
MAKKKTPAESTATSSPAPASTPRRRTPANKRTTDPVQLVSSDTREPTAAHDASGITRASGNGATSHGSTALPSAAPSYEQIAEAAYHRYLKRGGSHGQDFDDWLEAERDLRTGR